MGFTQDESGRIQLRLTISPERWNRSKGLRNWLTFAFGICALGAVGNWYNWLHGIGSLVLPIGLTAGAAIALMVTPKRWTLLVMSAGGLLGLEILAIILRKGPLGPMLEAMVVTAAVAAVCQYVRARVEGSQGGKAVRQPDGKQD